MRAPAWDFETWKPSTTRGISREGRRDGANGWAFFSGSSRDDSDNKFGRHEKQMNKLIHWATVKQVRNVARGKFELIEFSPYPLGHKKKKSNVNLFWQKVHTKCSLNNIGPDFGTRDSGFDPWQQEKNIINVFILHWAKGRKRDSRFDPWQKGEI